MTNATGRARNEPWPVLPPPDLSDTYRSWPQTWQTGAVLLANRLLAAAYRADVLEVVERIRRDAEAGVIRGISVEDYLEEQTEGHPRVVDTNLALQCLIYSPTSQAQFLADVPLTQAARACFRDDVYVELEAHGVLGEDGAGLDLPESPF